MMLAIEFELLARFQLLPPSLLLLNHSSHWMQLPRFTVDALANCAFDDGNMALW